MLAKILGPHRWVPCIIFIWGLITLCQAFLTSKGGFYATRFLLACGEVSHDVPVSEAFQCSDWP